MKCPNCHEQLGAVVPVISLEAAEADAKRYRDLHEISDECVNDLKEQLSCADAEVRTLEMRLMAARSARANAESALADKQRELAGARAAADTAIEAHVKAAKVIAEHEPRLAAARTAREQAEARARALEAELAQLKQPAAILREAQEVLRADNDDGIMVTHVFFGERTVLLTVDSNTDYEGATLAEAYEQWAGVDGPDMDAAKLTGGRDG